MDKEKMKRLGNMRRFPIRLKQAHDSEYQKVYMYLENEVDTRIQELEERVARLRAGLQSIQSRLFARVYASTSMQLGEVRKMHSDIKEFLDIDKRATEALKEGEDERAVTEPDSD